MTPDDDPKRELSFKAALPVLLGFIAALVVIPILVAPLFRAYAPAGFMAIMGLLFLLPATRHPWWLFDVLNTRVGGSPTDTQVFLLYMGMFLFVLAGLAAAQTSYHNG